MKTFFKELFEYNNHFNKKWAKLILANQSIVTEKSTKLFCHILNAHEIWNSRIQGKPNAYGVWDVHNPNNFEDIIRLNQENTTIILEKESLDGIIIYPKGKMQKTKKVSEVLFHIINHSTYHRGQIAMDFRENGMSPIATDYIHYETKA